MAVARAGGVIPVDAESVKTAALRLGKRQSAVHGMRGVVNADGLAGGDGTRDTFASLVNQLTCAHGAIQSVGLEADGPPLDACNLADERCERGHRAPADPVAMALIASSC